MPGSMSFEFSFKPVVAQPESDELPMHILLLDNFSGQRTRSALPERTFASVDIDNFDQVLARHAPVLDLDLSGTQIHLQFRNLDDFLPDSLYRNVPLFAALREQLKKDLMQRAPAPAPAPASAGDNPFQALLGGNARLDPTPTLTSTAVGGFDAMIKQMLAPHLTPLTPSEPPELAALQDAACSLLMRAILQHPAFQALEAAWRGVHFMLTQLELDHNLRLFLLDVSKPELAADCSANQAQLERSASFQLLAERWQRAASPIPWSLLVCGYQFDAGEADVALLAAMGALARQVNAPWLATAESAVLGCKDYLEHSEPRDWVPDEKQQARWKALAASSQAPWLGLVMQRMLLRLPYGANTDPVEYFNFEEMSGVPQPGQFLWGSGALAVAALLAQSFLEDGWDMEPGSLREIGELPAYTYKLQGESILQPCAESALLERAVDVGIAAGLMPLQGFKNRNAVRLLSVQSLARTELAGRWS